MAFFAGVGTDAQFVFDRTGGAGLDDGRQCLAVSLSAAESYIGMASADLVAHFTAELARLLPAAADATVTESIVTREHSATFLGAPGTHSLRAGVESGLPGVYLAGAWSGTGWPATMEGAGPQRHRGRPPRGPLRVQVRGWERSRFRGLR